VIYCRYVTTCFEPMTPKMIASRCMAVGINGIMLSPGTKSKTVAKTGKITSHFLSTEMPRSHAIAIKTHSAARCHQNEGLISPPADTEAALRKLEFEPNIARKYVGSMNTMYRITNNVGCIEILLGWFSTFGSVSVANGLAFLLGGPTTKLVDGVADFTSLRVTNLS